MTGDYAKIGALSVEKNFLEFVQGELLPSIGIDPADFWHGVERVVGELTPVNRELLAKRDELQQKLDDWHRSHEGIEHDDYVAFLREIGYLVEEGPAFRITTANVDDEIAAIAGPQLVVPVSNARFALNAANARWGSLYDALYGTNVIDEEDGRERGGEYNPVRGAAVIARAAEFLDAALPLAEGSHASVDAYQIDKDLRPAGLAVRLKDGSRTALADPNAFVAYREDGAAGSLLFRHNGLHIEIVIDAEHPVGKEASAHVADVMLEAAVTTIQDCEDSVAAVDSADKTAVYWNWLGLMEGRLETEFSKDGKTISRRLKGDRRYHGVDGSDVVLPGRSLMLVRNVGHLMQTDAILDADGEEVFEGILDAVFTVGCALNDIRGRTQLSNSRRGSIYIVKPKMHGPEEAVFCDRLMAAVEDLYGLPTNTIKVGVMDEERRTTVNLAECIRAVRERLVFINTGFLDRTGDEIHTSMQAGPMLRKEAIKSEPWIRAYENWNVDVGIRCGLPGKAQIGKGMFPKTDEMREMLDTKQAHPEAGANCAWVPSPTAATLHAMHYHAVDVFARLEKLASRPHARLEDILQPPLGDPAKLSAGEIQRELDNNVQGILGYVVRWINHGIGCSKVPDVDGVNLMEDRATLRISSQHIANWLLHGVCSEDDVRKTLLRMAEVVDRQNAGDPDYEKMADDPEGSVAFQAASALIFEGVSQPNGYTEPLLHGFRRRRKSETAGGKSGARRKRA